MEKKKIAWINPGIHNVYLGWLYFFEKYYDLSIYTLNGDIKFKNSYKLNPKSIKDTNTNYYIKFVIPDLKEYDYVIVGDIFTNNIPYKLKGDNIILYSEFFGKGKGLLKNLVFKIICFLFFRNKKILLPTKLAMDTFSSVSKSLFYLPQIYYGDIYENKHNDYSTIKLLFVGRISNQFKNINFLVDSYLNLRRKGIKIELTLVGRIVDLDFKEKYLYELENGIIQYHDFKSEEELREIYISHDILVLPSSSDPIGAVIEEAMAHSLAIMVSDTAGASGYIQYGQNGYSFMSNRREDFEEKIIKLIEDIEFYKANSLSIIRDNYRFKNEELMNKLYREFNDFCIGTKKE